MNNRKAFTLVEVVTAVAVASILLAAIGSLLLGSFKIAQLLDARKDGTLETALIGLEKMASELQHAPVYPTEPLEGDTQKITFHLLSSDTGTHPKLKAFELGQVQNVSLSGSALWIKKIEYSFDAGKGVLMRRTETGEERVLADHLAQVEFSYALRDPVKAKEITWEWKDKLTSPEEEKRLKAIRVRLTFQPSPYRYVLPGIEKTFLVIRSSF